MKKRKANIAAIAKGFFAAALITLLLMAVLTVIVWKVDVDDAMLVLVNQLLKIAAVALGTYVAVGRGGQAGFLTGAAVGTLYIALGYALYAALGGPVSVSSILGEWMTGAAAGALTGAIAANLPARSRRRAR